MNFPLESNDNESTYDLINSNADDKQSENSENSVYPESESESECVINYESGDTLALTKDRAKESEEDKESSLLTKERNRTSSVDNLTKEFNQKLHLK